MFATLKKTQLTQFRNFKDLAIMRNLNKENFLTVAALATDKVTIVSFTNGEWFANAVFTLKNKWVYVDTQMYKGATSREKFERQVKNSGLEIEHETVQLK